LPCSIAHLAEGDRRAHENEEADKTARTRDTRLCVAMQGNVTAEKRYKNLDMQPLSGLMASLGHTWIDVLKVTTCCSLCTKP